MELSHSPVNFHEAQFVALPGQSNIYGLLNLCIGGLNKLVVATVRGQIFCLEFQRDSLRPTLRPINFTYIPADAEVVSIDTFVKEPNGVIIGVTLVKRDSDPKEANFNLYGIHSDPTAPFQWEKIAEDWQTLDLKFIPFQLTHTQILSGDQWETVFLLPGDDCKVHMYKEVWQSELCFQEESSEMCFPELQGLPSSVVYMDMKLVGCQRLTAIGCQNGYLKCALVDLAASSILKTWSTKIIDGPITSVKLFTKVSGAAKSPAGQHSDNPHDFHLLVTSAVELGVVFLNPIEQGLAKPLILPSSHLHDSVLCSVIADVNWDGKNELVLGTYGKEIMVYQLQSVEIGEDQFELEWQRSFAHPIHCLWYGDLTNDGLCELVVVSMGGVHILQHDLKQASAMCVNRLLAMSKNKVEADKDSTET